MNTLGNTKRVIRNLYRTLLPASARNSTTVAKLKAKFPGHDWFYDSDYYDKEVEGPTVRSPKRIAN
jgi:hypothetical protein